MGCGQSTPAREKRPESVELMVAASADEHSGESTSDDFKSMAAIPAAYASSVGTLPADKVPDEVTPSIDVALQDRQPDSQSHGKMRSRKPYRTNPDDTFTGALEHRLQRSRYESHLDSDVTLAHDSPDTTTSTMHSSGDNQLGPPSKAYSTQQQDNKSSGLQPPPVTFPLAHPESPSFFPSPPAHPIEVLDSGLVNARVFSPTPKVLGQRDRKTALEQDDRPPPTAEFVPPELHHGSDNLLRDTKKKDQDLEPTNVLATLPLAARRSTPPAPAARRTPPPAQIPERAPRLKAVSRSGLSLSTRDVAPRAHRAMVDRLTDSPRDSPVHRIQPLNFPQESPLRRSSGHTTGGAIGSPITAAQFALNQTDNYPPRSPTSTSSASSSRIRSKSTSSIRNEPFVPPRGPVRTRSPPPSLARDAMLRYFVPGAGGSGAVTPLSDVDLAILQELNLSELIQDIALISLASGGFSDVNKGSLVRDGTVTAVALKSLRSVYTNGDEVMGINQIPQRMKIRLAREMRIWIGLRHPRILRLLGFAFLKNKACLVSPWYDNGNVKVYLARNPTANRRKMVVQAAEGLVYLHSRSPPVVHSDIKSLNVLVNDTGDVVLCDFGLSKLLDEGPTGLTTSTQMFHTLRSSAPELLEDQPHTTESDVYAFGCLTLEIMTGKYAFYGLKSNTAVVASVCLGRMPESEDYPELPSDDPLWDFMRRCWQKDHKLRPTIFEAHAQLIEIC